MVSLYLVVMLVRTRLLISSGFRDYRNVSIEYLCERGDSEGGLLTGLFFFCFFDEVGVLLLRSVQKVRCHTLHPPFPLTDQLALHL